MIGVLRRMLPQHVRVRHVAASASFDRNDEFVLSDFGIKRSTGGVARWQECDIKLPSFEDSVLVQIAPLKRLFVEGLGDRTLTEEFLSLLTRDFVV